MLDLSARPFWLDRSGVQWVRQTLAAMTFDEKVGQLFCLVGRSTDTRELEDVLKILQPGGFMFRPGPAAEIRECHAFLQDRASIPLLLSANLEAGGTGIADEGTQFAAPLGVAATNDEQMAHRLGLVCGREGAAVGCNWTFSPNVDIDYNFQNPITNTRTYGSDPRRVLRMARAYIKAVQECGLGVTLKHWPGDGVDGRDQHLLTSVNTLSVRAWERSYGQVYAQLIAEGANAVMSAHIMLPEYSKQLLRNVRDDDILPATLARELNIDLLRKRLRFNGLIVTDATNMAGFTALMPREMAVPTAIAAGNDMFLFTVNTAEDFEFMKSGVIRRIIKPERLDEAVTAVLALKASLHLPQRKRDNTLVPGPQALNVIGCEEHRRWAVECANQAVTLVKDTQNILPITPATHKRLRVFIKGDQGGYLDNHGGKAGAQFVRRLKEEGFSVEVFDYSQSPKDIQKYLQTRSVADMRALYDAVIYLASIKTASNQTTVRLTWGQPMGFDCPKFISEVPTIFISIDNPYHLQDVPRVRTFINAYTSSIDVVDAVVDKLTGKSPFRGKSPVDPYCGYWDAKL